MKQTKEQSILLETSKLTQEKGFKITPDMWGNYYYYRPDGNRSCTNKIGYLEAFNKYAGQLYPYVSQGELQRWLREVHQIHIEIIEYNKDGSLIINIKKDKILIYESMTNFDLLEYELALEDALLEALKLIKSI